ncbi:MAG: phosphomannomutase/phosphoglucomutase [bacterium]|nr:phosphomannomutase/phosphoglucomutase [bacterium]MDZ4231723.1 phosphomannomutase/phosphoglucomutase [Candidatus Pacearchaeota archaeon]
MKIAPSVFREYDIRGIAGKEFSPEEIAKYEKWYGPFPGITLTPEAVLEIGKAYGTIIKRAGGKKVVVGYEVRPYGKELKDEFVSGVRSTGCDVIDAGISLTPIIYFATAFLGLDGGVNVTGSHNVYFYNGFKLMKKGVWPLFGQELQGMRTMIEKEDYERQTEGKLETAELFPTYEKYFLEHMKLAKKPRIVIDTGNGSAGIFAPELFKKLGCDVISIYEQPDATFPNHDPDPEGPQNMVTLGKKVVEEKADLGIAFDADGDRAGFVDEQGRFISADLPLLLFAKDALSRYPGKKILYDTKCSQLLEELVPQYGGVPMMHRTGHAPIKETLRKDNDIIFGGEVSGHFFFVEDYFKIDDGAFAAGKMLELFSRQEGSFSSMFRDIPKRVRTPEIKLPCKDEDKFEVVRKITEDLKTQYPAVLIDGVRIQVTEKSWGIIRASNTSPYLTVRVEGASKEEVLKVKNILADELEKFPEIQDKLNRSEIVTLTGTLGWL